MNTIHQSLVMCNKKLKRMKKEILEDISSKFNNTGSKSVCLNSGAGDNKYLVMNKYYTNPYYDFELTQDIYNSFDCSEVFEVSCRKTNLCGGYNNVILGVFDTKEKAEELIKLVKEYYNDIKLLTIAIAIDTE
jgi:hypothetical protein